jgi:uncharacterized membrane protein
MINFIYNTLAAIGYTEPIHPPLVHIPMGMTIGLFLFSIVSYKMKELQKTAYHCLILSLIFAPIAAILGLMDWQHRYAGAWQPLIIAKMVLAVVFIILLALTAYLRYKEKVAGASLMILYILCLASAIGLGFMGGRLAYG